MSDKQIVVVGDIHGCLEEFEELLKVIQYNKEQMRLVLLGDLMDRGPNPVGVVRKVRELGVECVMGNHEEKHLRWHKHEKKLQETGKANPMRRMAQEAREANEALSDQDWTWLKALPLRLSLGSSCVAKDLWAIHGGCEPRFSLANQDPKQVIRCRYVNEAGVAVALGANLSKPEGTVYWAEKWRGPESIIYGHCVHDLTDVRVDEYIQPDGNPVRCIGIDTGCCFGGHLTAYIMSDTSSSVVQVKAKKKYYEGYGDE
jgi:bis(5'-nucleosyl)-tetraphosphatase (symmetrical)